MIDITPAQSRHFTDMGWLKTYWLFSFSDYYDPENLQHGKLRVFNDDVVEPQTGFPKHPHEEMEIISIVLSGEMTHKDTMGNTITVKAGDVQRMTAGTGLFHSEWNYGNEPVHFFQIWIYPDKRELTPSYHQRTFNPETWQNRLTLLASDKNQNGVVSLNTDGSIYRATLTADKTVNYSPESGRKTFVYVIDGRLSINGLELDKGSQARIDKEDNLEIGAKGEADFLLIDVPS
jgi:redox-sensitive bicupin YhaK (pirin superfamily)